MKRTYASVLIMAGLGFSCSLVNPDLEDLLYPTVLSPLDSTTLAQQSDEFSQLSNNEVCSVLNKYSFLEFDRPCVASNPVHLEITASEDEIVARAKEALVRLAQFTGVTLVKSLVVTESHGIEGCVICDGSDKNAAITRWYVTFGNQTDSGLEVLNTPIELMLDAEKVFGIHGHWFSDIVVPPMNYVSALKATRSVIGTDIVYYALASNPKTFTVSKASLKDEITKVILPVKVENSIELRVVWQIAIMYLSTDIPSWYIYIDTTTGETVATWQLFKT